MPKGEEIRFEYKMIVFAMIEYFFVISQLDMFEQSLIFSNPTDGGLNCLKRVRLISLRNE